jgi:hypothetical protein
MKRKRYSEDAEICRSHLRETSSKQINVLET